METMHVKGKQTPTQDRPKVNEEEVFAAKDRFDRRAEEVQAEHVHKQVPPIRMQKTAGDQPMIFLPGENGLRIKDILLLDRAASESQKGDEHRHGYYERSTKCHGPIHA